ncbi:MAG: hypothetical protein IPM97_16630 [Bdellovibrionaceae bacterium]|nr:hypothetical protein [Pseudobdellovibrionaceae bacterium]
MKFSILFFLIIAFNLPAKASLVLNPKYDLVGNRYTYWNRFILSSQADFTAKSFRFYTDIFGEYNINAVEDYSWRTVESKGFLQELYLEYSTDSLYLKLGRQAQRWSDSWVLPSLDIWTARKYERLFIDPLAFQLSHSTGATLSITKSHWQLDLVAFKDVAENTLPVLLPQVKDERETLNPGARFKFDLYGLQNSFVVARALKKNLVGYGVNYAFESWVPKFEIGHKENEQVSPQIRRENSGFASVGADIFVDRLMISPQFVVFNDDTDLENNTQGLHYLSLLYTNGAHEIQFMEFTNTFYKDQFYSAKYTITLKRSYSIGVFYQYYDGGIGTLTKFVNDYTNGNLFGLQLNLFTEI